MAVFSSGRKIKYWNTTYSVLVKNNRELVLRYAELGNVAVKKGQCVRDGELIGHIGSILDAGKTGPDAPLYIRRLKKKRNLSMLHFEVHRAVPSRTKKYLGGNWFGAKKPKALLDAEKYLRDASARE